MVEKVNPDLLTKLLQQSPLFIILFLAVYVMWKYISEKDKVIKEKDTLMNEQQQKLMVLYGQAIESQNRLTTVIEELRKDFERSNKH